MFCSCTFGEKINPTDTDAKQDIQKRSTKLRRKSHDRVPMLGYGDVGGKIIEGVTDGEDGYKPTVASDTFRITPRALKTLTISSATVEIQAMLTANPAMLM